MMVVFWLYRELRPKVITGQCSEAKERKKGVSRLDNKQTI